MKKFSVVLSLVLVGTVVMTAVDAKAQSHFRSRRACAAAGPVIYSGQDAEGMVQTNDVGFVGPLRSAKMALHDPFSPSPYYAYSNRGINSGLTHQWNQSEAAGRPWHGDFNNWRWGEPTALVVPPTAAYQSSYAWGVGQVRSTPIHHQFGRGSAGMIGGGGGGQFSNTPYWPSSTDQFGVYPVRAPW
jgi:hypothetical protein